MLAHELRGQGGTFGYPLITTFGKMLYESTLEGCREDDRAVEMIKAHIDSISVVIREKVSGDGGKLGRELLASLKAALEKARRSSTEASLAKKPRGFASVYFFTKSVSKPGPVLCSRMPA